MPIVQNSSRGFSTFWLSYLIHTTILTVAYTGPPKWELHLLYHMQIFFFFVI